MSDSEVTLVPPGQNKIGEEFEGISESFFAGLQRTVKDVSNLSKLENVAIFVDYDNVYHGLMNEYNHDPDNDAPAKNLFRKLWSRYGQDHIRSFRAYADFEKLKQNLTSLQKKRIQLRHVYSNGKLADGRKNSSDIELCIDAIESTYKDKTISTYVFVTADSDMIPIMSRLMYKGKRVELFYMEKSAPQHVDISSYADAAMSLEEFLEVEVSEYKVDDYVLDALSVIDEWYKVPQPENWIGAGWLRSVYQRKFYIPANVASDLLEHLRVNKLIYDGQHELADKTKKSSIMVSSQGLVLLRPATEAAPTSEKGEK